MLAHAIEQYICEMSPCEGKNVSNVFPEPYQKYPLIGMKKCYIIYWTNQREWERECESEKMVSCEKLRYNVFKVFS